MAIDWAKVKGVIFDFDGVFTKNSFMYSDSARDVFLNASADAVLKYSNTSDDRDIVKQSHLDAFTEYHDLGHDVLCAKYNVKSDDFQREFHIGCWSGFSKEQSFLDHFDDLAPLLAGMSKSGRTMSILSAGHKQAWIQSVLKSQEWCKYFDHNLIHGFKESGEHRKGNSQQPFIRIVNAMGIQPEECVMVEDSSRNLVIPYNDLGMQTAWIHDGKPESLKEDHKGLITQSFNCFADFLTDCNAFHIPQKNDVSLKLKR